MKYMYLLYKSFVGKTMHVTSQRGLSYKKKRWEWLPYVLEVKKAIFVPLSMFKKHT